MTALMSKATSRIPEPTVEENRLIEAWRHEFMHVAMMTAFVTMGCNGLGDHASRTAIAAVEANLPETPAVYRAIHQGLLDIPSRYDPAFAAVTAAHDQLSISLAAFRKASSQQLPWTPEISVQLAEIWRATCRSFSGALDIFDSFGLLRAGFESGTTLNAQCPMRLMQLLRAAYAGESLASSGVACAVDDQLPDWVQRRRWDRRAVNMICRLESRGGVVQVVMQNISMGGALLDGAPMLIRGARVVITTDTGRVLRAIAMWSRGRSAGVKFEDQLLYNDPLIEIE